MATTDNELNDLIINDISQEEYDNLVATGQVQEGQIYATDGAGGGDIDISHINNESVVTKDLTVGTDEGTLNLSITAGVATIATNNGLDIVSQTKFDTAPTTDDTTTWANANDTSLVTKRQVASEINENYTSIITYVGEKDREIKSDITQLDTNIRTVGDWVNAKDESGNRATLTTEAQDAYRAINELNAKIDEGGGGASLPDQTGNAGKLLTTDGTTASWSQYSFVRTVQDGYYEQVNISQKKDAIGDSISFGVAIAATSVGSFGVSIGGRSGVNATSIGFSAEASGIHSVSIGAFSIASGTYSVQLGYGTNKDANTFKVANQNGNFEMMSADGTIPAERMSSTAGTTGQVLTKTDDGMAWQDAAKGDASLPILMAIWSDHVINDMSWLRADTFSWQSGDVYKAAYEHLAADLGDSVYYIESSATNPGHKFVRAPEQDDNSTEHPFAWYDKLNYTYIYTNNENPIIGETIYFEHTGSLDGGTVAVYGQTYSDVSEQTDTIGDTTITYYLAEDGHKICLPDQESNIVALYEKTGAADYYLLDTTNKQFKLPRKQKRKLIQAVKNGNTWYNLYSDGWVEQGGKKTKPDSNSINIPLIVQMIDANYSVQITDKYAGNMATAPAYNIVDSNNFTIYQGNGAAIDCDWQVCGYAAESAYASAGMNLEYYYVGNFEQSAVEQTAGLNAELFNSKADSDLKNTPLASLDNDDGKLKWDGINMSAMGMPSNKADSLIIGSSGATYTAPADGYFITRGTANIAGAYIVISNENIQLANNPIAFSEGGGLSAFLPVKKGDVIYIWYANVTFNHFRFIYAEGAK